MPPAQPPYFLAIDGGGSKTLAIIVDAAGRESGRGVAGSSNHEAVGRERAVAELHSAARAAMAQAELTMPLEAAWLGLAGVDHQHDVDALLPRVRDLARTVTMTNDAELVLGALPGSIGVAVIAGTGSIALGQNAASETARAGGWGHVMGDEGSGYAIGREALQAAVRAADGRGQATVLLEGILATWDLASPELLLGHVYRAFDKTAIAALAPLVLTSAGQGDTRARRIVRRAANELALAVTTVGRALHFSRERLPLALGGGLLAHGDELRALLLRRLARDWTVEAAIVAQPALCAARALRERSRR
jgi:N-acetylglucosamine kinase-like BadF-type ATPase